MIWILNLIWHVYGYNGLYQYIGLSSTFININCNYITPKIDFLTLVDLSVIHDYKIH